VRESRSPERRQAIAEFMSCWHKISKITPLTLAAYLEQYRQDQVAGRPNEQMRLRALDDFCRAVGLQTELAAIQANTYRQAIDHVAGHSLSRAVIFSQRFFGYCAQQRWLCFEPPSLSGREQYQKVLEPGFLADQGGKWIPRLRLYLTHLKDQRNLSDGGIDYYARKLKVFVTWLDCRQISGAIPQRVLKQFLAEKHHQGCKAQTLSKYLYAVRYFFDFLIQKGLTRNNP
jgi:site-specific recombinase XerD